MLPWRTLAGRRSQRLLRNQAVKHAHLLQRPGLHVRSVTCYAQNPENVLLKLGIDEQICAQVTLRPIHEIGEQLGLDEDMLIPYGHYKAKINVAGTSQKKNLHEVPRTGKLVLVTAMSPTKAGEGKTTTTVGLTDGINRVLRKRMDHPQKTAVACLREPSLGPVFGMKGGGAGGGRAQIAPMDEINLHFTGDFHAISAAHNLLAALLDNHVYFRKPPEIDVRRVSWKRVVDMNDRGLRKINCGLGGAANGYPREDGFDITVASEVMAVLCLSRDVAELERRLGQIVIGSTRPQGGTSTPITARDLQASNAMAALLKDAMLPNLVQTLEHSPALVHGGPFANIAHGCNSLVATDLGLKVGDYVVTEAGFGADLGAEKFLDIKCRAGGLKPDLITMVVSCRAAKLHGGANAKELAKESLEQLEAGLANVRRHCENLAKFKVPVMICVNRFPTDTTAEEKLMIEECRKMENVIDCVLSDHWARGGEGAEAFAESALQYLDSTVVENKFEPLYPLELPLNKKIETVAKEIYRASSVVYKGGAAAKLSKFQKEYGHFPICVAKTQYSFSDNAALLNAPEGHTFNVTDVKLSAGAEFIVVQSGDIMTMPGLPKEPAAQRIGITKEGKIAIEGHWVHVKREVDRVNGHERMKVDHVNDPKIISGLEISKTIRSEIKVEVQELKGRYDTVPGLGVLMIGNRPDSATYVMAKTKQADECGFTVKSHLLPESITEEEAWAAIDALNQDPEIHGILAQLPTPVHINEQNLLTRIDVRKDVDGFRAQNIGNVALKGGDPYAVSCTPLGVMEMLKRSGVEISGKTCVVLGRSNIVGMPLTLLLHRADGTVTMCHSKTKNLKEKCQEADILCAAIGKPSFVPGDWIKPGAVVIDVGINLIEDKSRKSGFRLVGDVDFESAYERASKITPVPGGVGPMTVAMLLKNVLSLCKMRLTGRLDDEQTEGTLTKIRRMRSTGFVLPTKQVS